jgi:SAM-dependent methyltransferase
MGNFICRMCSFKDFELLWDLKNATYGDLFKTNFEEALKVTFHSFILVRCSNCKLLQLRDSTDITGQYDEYLYSSKTTNALGDYYALTTSRIVNEYEISPGSFVLDIGSNDGSFLLEFKSLGMRVLGVEPAKPASILADGRGIETLNEYFADDTVAKILSNYGSPKLISINYTLANIPNLVEFFNNLVSLMNDETVLSIITGYHIDQFSINMFDYIGHDHLTYITLNDLDFISKEFNLKLLDVNRSEHKGGSIHVSLALNSSKLKSRSSIKQLIQREIWERSKENQGILDLKYRIDNIAKETNKIVETFLGSPIYGIGASISTSYLLNYFELDKYIKELYDDDSNKIGKFSPGIGKHVSSINDLPNHSDSLAIILAWQHTNRILERLKQVGFTGKIFAPLPFPRYLDYQSIDQKDLQ